MLFYCINLYSTTGLNIRLVTRCSFISYCITELCLQCQLINCHNCTCEPSSFPPEGTFTKLLLVSRATRLVQPSCFLSSARCVAKHLHFCCFVISVFVPVCLLISFFSPSSFAYQYSHNHNRIFLETRFSV